MQWLKAFHIIAMVCWFAGLFYLPRLFVYHAMSIDNISNERFKVMERRLYYGIMAPAGLLTVLFGIWLISYIPPEFLHAFWFQAKLSCVFLLIIFHLVCGKFYRDFKADRNQHSHVFYRWFNEIPTVLLLAIIILAEVHPF